MNSGARLPEGWEVKVNPITQQPYYKKVVDGQKETSYVPPREPPRQPTEEEAIIEREQLMKATRAVYRKHDLSLVESVESLFAPVPRGAEAEVFERICEKYHVQGESYCAAVTRRWIRGLGWQNGAQRGTFSHAHILEAKPVAATNI